MLILSHTKKLEHAARLLDDSEDYCVLRRIPAPFQRMEESSPPDAKCVALVDLETTGLSLAEDEVIELAILLAWVSEEGELLAHLGPWSWLSDPGRALTPEIMWLTGLTDLDLAGQTIDLEKVKALLNRADLTVAHNAGFDIRWLDKLLPELADMPWACSMAEIDWRALGCEGRSQPYLLSQHGWFSNFHRASDDVWSLLWLLMQKRSDRDGENVRSHFARLLESAEQPSMLISAKGAPFAAKDELKARGFRWNALKRVWQKQVRLDDASTEMAWFREKALPEPSTKAVTAAERYR